MTDERRFEILSPGFFASGLLYQRDADNAMSLLANADAALYREEHEAEGRSACSRAR
jgi:hypothetical protein